MECRLIFRQVLVLGFLEWMCRSSFWKKLTLSLNVSEPPEKTKQNNISKTLKRIDATYEPAEGANASAMWNSVSQPQFCLFYRLFWSNSPMFLCKKRINVAAIMFLSLQLSSTGGWIPSSTTSVRYLWTGSGPWYVNCYGLFIIQKWAF